MTIDVRLRGIGVIGPGLDGWAATAERLRDPARWEEAATAIPAPQRLPANERRRAGAIVKLSIAVADQAVAAAGLDPAPIATVYTSSSSDTQNCHALCEALAEAERHVSPTRFTNSVHNAAAGYWHIATASRAPSTSLCAYDASFGAGLLEAAAQCASERRPVLLVAADVPYPEPLHAKRPLPQAFGVALLLDAAGDGAALRIGVAPDAVPTVCDELRLEALRRAVPAARALPLLQALARGGAARVLLDHLDGLPVEIEVAA